MQTKSKWQAMSEENWCDCGMPNGEHLVTCACATKRTDEGAMVHIPYPGRESNNVAACINTCWHVTAGDLTLPTTVHA